MRACGITASDMYRSSNAWVRASRSTVRLRSSRAESLSVPLRSRHATLRAGAAMIIAGLAAPGTTSIDDVYYIERGYDDVVGKLRSVGADITLQHVPDESVFNKAN